MFKLKIINKPKMIKMKCNIEFPDVVLANLQDKETTPTKETQEIIADSNYDGLSKVTVNPIPDEYIIPIGEIEFTQNGTYEVTDKASAKVNVPEKQLGTKTITTNGTYNARDDNLDGYSEVEVATSGVDINEYLSDKITKGTSSSGGWLKTIIKLRSPLTIEGTDARYMFNNYLLNELPQIDTSNVTNMGQMFYGCTNLTTIPQIDTSNVTNMSQMFNYCTNLTTIPQLNTSNVTNTPQMFYGCTNLTTIPPLDTSNVTNMSYMFGSCTNLTTIPPLDTSNVTNMSYMFGSCTNLTTIPPLNGEKLTVVTGAFSDCKSLENFNGLINLGQAYQTSQSANYSNYKLNLISSNKLTHDSLINVINNLYDIKTKGVKPQQLVLGNTNLAKLTAEEVAIATNKGWTVS